MIESNAQPAERRVTVLDIDLDFFLSEITWQSTEQDQRQLESVVPWSEREVREFLENQCKLSAIKRKPGEIVTTHDQVIELWKELIQSKRLQSPFDVIHVDAHADLGMGDPSWAFICTELLTFPAEKRQEVTLRDFNEGNYLAFALAFRWISSLRYVHHPKLNRALGDVPPVHLKGQDSNQKVAAIQLKVYRPQDVDLMIFHPEEVLPIGWEPEVPFIRVSGTEYLADHSPDFVFIAHSPRYTPKSADSLLDVVGKYIRPI
jgi:hypothetical protein